MSGSSAAPPVRIGVIGLGSFGRLHALTLSGIAEAELVAVVDKSGERLDEIGEELPGVSRWDDLEEAFESSTAEAWIVASSTATHAGLTERILTRGLPVLVEKPLAVSLAYAERLAPLVKPDSSNLMMGHIVLFNTEFRKLSAIVRERPPLSYISCTRHRPSETLRLYPGENPFHLLMVHDLYSVLALVGGREPVGFSAQAREIEGGESDLALAQLSWDDGLVASFTASYLAPQGMGNDGYDRMELYGHGWASRIDPNPRPITVWDECSLSPLTHDILLDENGACGMLAEELRTFCRVVRGSSPVPAGASYHDAVTVERWIGRLEQCCKKECG